MIYLTPEQEEMLANLGITVQEDNSAEPGILLQLTPTDLLHINYVQGDFHLELVSSESPVSKVPESVKERIRVQAQSSKLILP